MKEDVRQRNEGSDVLLFSFVKLIYQHLFSFVVVFLRFLIVEAQIKRLETFTSLHLVCTKMIVYKC